MPFLQNVRGGGSFALVFNGLYRIRYIGTATEKARAGFDCREMARP
jgi:hypothetical protein